MCRPILCACSLVPRPHVAPTQEARVTAPRLRSSTSGNFMRMLTGGAAVCRTRAFAAGRAARRSTSRHRVEASCSTFSGNDFDGPAQTSLATQTSCGASCWIQTYRRMCVSAKAAAERATQAKLLAVRAVPDAQRATVGAAASPCLPRERSLLDRLVAAIAHVRSAPAVEGGARAAEPALPIQMFCPVLARAFLANRRAPLALPTPAALAFRRRTVASGSAGRGVGRVGGCGVAASRAPDEARFAVLALKEGPTRHRKVERAALERAAGRHLIA
jgi:hypothetical protein